MQLWAIVVPEWWTWILSGLVWIWLAANAAPEISNEPVLCISSRASADSSSGLPGTAMVIGKELIPWMLMVIGMMYPLLSEQIRHIAFSVQRMTKDVAIVFFLFGYTLAWMIVGVMLLILSFYLQPLLGDTTYLSGNLVAAIGFLVASILAWLPSRRVSLAACGRTMPIRIRNWQSFVDSLDYGFRMGLVCVRICWAPMFAVMLVTHNVFVMAIITGCLLVERYRLPHKARIIAFMWGAIGLIFLAIGLL